MKEYAIYRGDEFKYIGTAEECAEFLGCKVETFKFYLTPTYQRRVEKRKRPKNYIVVVRLDDEE
ncbi:hypothetical protein P4482_09190 [Neobacillus thermocopriae]|jgi:hypothetical protein|uniref:hypothetical protein n=1 Tax=Neobacillus thermocopriae TaxID=1215031 RepID=UPI002E24F5E9|nr:hypothetical protein [Neobacillus thermocopriae]MED3714393.1 hypothetical protein [Neobacillus thermocopriae]